MASEQEEQYAHQQLYYLENVAHNAKQTYYVRSVSLSVAGSVAGVLGLTNFSGFYFYAIALLLVNTTILLLNARGSPSKYFVTVASAHHQSQSGSSDASSKSANAPPAAAGNSAGKGGVGMDVVAIAKTVIEGAQENMFSYVLWWTFWYGIVHVYD